MRNGFFLISIHALLAESDDKNECTNLAPKPFLSTLSLRRATAQHASNILPDQHFYPRSPCGERRFRRFLFAQSVKISIHALLAESDFLVMWTVWPSTTFLSTLSLRRATKFQQSRNSQNIISIHALLAESAERANRLAHAPPKISIHALLAESDCRRTCENCKDRQFLSTLSLRRATPAGRVQRAAGHQISIHALLAESDGRFGAVQHTQINISIHALLAESDMAHLMEHLKLHCISIHALLAESDKRINRNIANGQSHFYPRSPCGERLPRHSADCNCRSISIHALLAESDSTSL